MKKEIRTSIDSSTLKKTETKFIRRFFRNISPTENVDRQIDVQTGICPPDQPLFQLSSTGILVIEKRANDLLRTKKI